MQDGEQYREVLRIHQKHRKAKGKGTELDNKAGKRQDSGQCRTANRAGDTGKQRKRELDTAGKRQDQKTVQGI
jgi:hypothetical protein